MAESIFRQESLEHVSSPEQLYDYLKVSNPGIWIIILAIAALMAGAAVWAVTGDIPTTISLTGRSEGSGSYSSYLRPETAGAIKPGMVVRIGGREGKVQSVAETPESRQEAARRLGSDYAAYSLRLSDWNIRIEVQVPSPEDPVGSLLNAAIITDNTRPLNFLFN
jgi:hypothetical protein